MVVHLFLNNNKALDFLPINSIKNGGITFKIQKILSEYDASERIYFMEVDFKWKDHKGKTHNCSGQVQTQGYNSNRHAVDIPYVCYRVAGLG